MVEIINGIVDRKKVIQHLNQSKLLTKHEILIIQTTRSRYQIEVIIRLVADRILTGNKDDITKLAIFMESHWLLNHLFHYWNNARKHHDFITLTKGELFTIREHCFTHYGHTYKL